MATRAHRGSVSVVVLLMEPLYLLPLLCVLDIVHYLSCPRSYVSDYRGIMIYRDAFREDFGSSSTLQRRICRCR